PLPLLRPIRMRRSILRPRAGLVSWTALLGLVLPVGLAGQASPPRTAEIAHQVFAGSEMEDYLRTLQNVGALGPRPWAIRGLSAAELRRVAVGEPLGPWSERVAITAPDGPLELGWTSAGALASFNSTFPYGGNDGPVWAGRGLTSELRLGAYG